MKLADVALNALLVVVAIVCAVVWVELLGVLLSWR